MKKIVLLFVLFLTVVSYSQEKRLWAKSYIDKKAPKLVVQKWLSKKPKTKGKFVLIEFWATWCAPCRKAIPKMNKFQEEFKDNLVVIGISDERKSTVRKFKNPKIEYYSAIDTKKRLKNVYEVSGVPHCVIINPDGFVVWEGWPDLKGFELTSDVIKELIKNN